MRSATADMLGLDFRVVAMVSHVQQEPAKEFSQEKQKRAPLVTQW